MARAMQFVVAGVLLLVGLLAPTPLAVLGDQPAVTLTDDAVIVEGRYTYMHYTYTSPSRLRVLSRPAVTLHIDNQNT